MRVALQWRYALVAIWCGVGFGAPTVLPAQTQDGLPAHVVEQFGAPPAVPDGPLSDDLRAALDVAFIETMEQSAWGADQMAALSTIVKEGDPRVAWIISDLMRFTGGRRMNPYLGGAAGTLLGIEVDLVNPWGDIVDHLIAWDIPAPPDYLRYKRAIFTTLVPGWERLFVEGDIDWRLVSWAGC